MGFFATFSTWLNGILAGYIGTNTARIASLLQPAVLTLATVYIMVWGYLQLTGKIEEPFINGLKRIILLVVVLGGALICGSTTPSSSIRFSMHRVSSPQASSAPTTRSASSIRSSSPEAMPRAS